MTRAELVDGLNTVANVFNELARRTVPMGQHTLLKRQAATMRLVATNVYNGTYTYELGLAWFDAGRLTIERTRKTP